MKILTLEKRSQQILLIYDNIVDNFTKINISDYKFGTHYCHILAELNTSSSAMAERPRKLDQRFQVGVNLRLNYRLKG